MWPTTYKKWANIEKSFKKNENWQIWKFSKNIEKTILSIIGSFFEWFWTCGQKIIFRLFRKKSNFLEKVVFSLKTVRIQWFCVFYHVERKMLISAISRINSNLHVSIFVFSKIRFFVHFDVFSNGSSSAFLSFRLQNAKSVVVF